MKRFEGKKLNRKSHKLISIIVGIVRIITIPIFIPIRMYCWVWDYNYYDRFKH